MNAFLLWVTLIWALILAIPLVVSWILCLLLIRFAPSLGLVDHPDPRKVHTNPTPRAGGLAIAGGLVVGLVFVSLVVKRVEPLDPRWLFGALVVVIGLLDDRVSLPWQFRLLSQFGIATGAVLHGVPLDTTALPPWLLAALAVLWTVCLVNAFNMLDNMDLLSGGTAWIATLCVFAISIFDDSANAGFACLALLGALTGFLWFNRPPARLFMGDSGSTFLGFFLAVTTVQLIVSSPKPVWHWAVPVCLLAVPIYDLVTVVTLRLVQGHSPFHADKQHVSHRLVAAGYSKPAAVAILHLLALASGALGVVLYRVTEPAVAAVVGTIFLAGWGVVIWFDLPRMRRMVRGEQGT